MVLPVKQLTSARIRENVKRDAYLSERASIPAEALVPMDWLELQQHVRKGKWRVDVSRLTLWRLPCCLPWLDKEMSERERLRRKMRTSLGTHALNGLNARVDYRTRQNKPGKDRTALTGVFDGLHV